MGIDLLIVAAFVIYSVSVGFACRRQASRGLEEYFLAGRTLPGWKAGFSMAATQYAADTPLLVTGLIATAGIFSLWRLWVYALAFLLMGFVLGPSWRRAGVLTDAELTELRYAGPAALWLRVLKAIHLETIVNCTVLAMVLVAAVRLCEPFLAWHQFMPPKLILPLAGLLQRIGFPFTTLAQGHPHFWLYSASNFISITLIVCFVWLYSSTGGLRSVVETDVVQFSLAMAATLLYAVIVIGKIGGLDALPARLEALYGSDSRRILSFGPLDWNAATWLFISVLAVQWFAQINADGTGYLAQRTMACRSDRDARIAAVTFSFAQILLRSLFWLPIALGLLILYPAAAPSSPEAGTEAFRIAREASFAAGIRDFLPAGIRGVMLTGMLAALASTIDTHLNWGASYWVNDLYKRLVMERWLRRKPGGGELVWVARLSTVGILVIALAIAIRLNSIQAAWHLSLLFGSGVGAVLILRWLWHRINVYSEIAAGVASLALAPALLIGWPGGAEEVRLLVLAAGSLVATITVTLLTPAEPKQTLQRFYERARPAGFWSPVAVAVGEDPKTPVRRLARGLTAAALASFTLFSILTGTAILLTRSPQGYELCRALLLIAAGAVCLPVWIKLGFREAAPPPG